MALIGGSACMVQAQTPTEKVWSLRECIDYAIEHNINIKQTANTSDEQSVNVNTAKWARLPNVNGSAGQNWNWGRSASPKDNLYTDQTTANTSFGVGTNIPLFTGMRLSNEYDLAKLNLQATIEDLKKAKEDISINVASSYLQVLLDLELNEVANKQIEISKQQLHRLNELFKLGKASPAQVVEAEARVAQDQMNAVKSENTYRLSLLALSQLLELPTPEGLKLAIPEDNISCNPLTPIDDIYVQATANKASIKAAQYRLDAVDKSIKIAKSSYYPTLDLSAGLRTGYYTVNGKSDESFGSQLKNSFNKYIGVSLNVPIFNRFATRNNVRKARIQQIGQTLQLDNTKKVLYKEIQQSWYSALNAESQYNSSQFTVNANEKAFELMSEKFANGKATSLEYNEAKFNLAKAQSEKIQAKYNYIFSSKIIDFYKGIPIE